MSRKPSREDLIQAGWLCDSTDPADVYPVDAPPTVPHFVTSARPLGVPPELLAMDAKARITYEHSIGRQRRSGLCNAGYYRQMVQDTIARQAEGYFTLNEAAQVLADSRPRLDPIKLVEHFRLAHSKGQLPIHHGESRFRLEVDEKVRDFYDLLEISKLDTWLRESAGYGFPPAPTITRQGTATAPEAPSTAPAAPEVQAAPIGGVQSARAIPTWWDVAGPYMIEKLRAGQFATAKELYGALHDEAGTDSSPFDKGTGQHRGSLFVREAAQTLALKTVQNKWAELMCAAASAK